MNYSTRTAMSANHLKNSSSCALNTGLDFHLLDHIAPLASMKQIPLIVTEEECAQLCATYYPEVQIKLMPDLELRYSELADQYDSLVQCRLWSQQLKHLFKNCFQKQMQLVFCPHGQSDKGYGAQVLAPYAHQDLVLLYGDLLKEMLMELHIWETIQAHQQIGNYRLSYYQVHRERMLQAANKQIFSQLSKANKTVLYAPTWNDADGATSFFKQCQNLLEQLPSHWNLILKLHPLLEQRDPALFYRLEILEQTKPNFIVVDQFPLVYPILEKIDAYLGDYSSVGYDALAFEKPLFFFQDEALPKARLHTCGQLLTANSNVFENIERNLPQAAHFKPIQQALYQKAFGSIYANGRENIDACQISQIARIRSCF